MPGDGAGGLPLDHHFDHRRASPLRHHARFTDREAELAALDEAMARLEADAEADGVGRRNVLALYGVGGVGKSALSHRMEARVQEGARSGAPALRLTCRLDVADPSLLHFEELLLRLRSSLATPGLALRSFDLVLAAYWARQHPGAPLATLARRASAVSEAARAVGLDVELQASIDAVVRRAGLVVSLPRTALAFYSLLRDAAHRRRLFRDAPFVGDVIDAPTPDDMLPFLPAVLDHDLRQARRRRWIDVAVFVDNWEHVQGRQAGPHGFEDRVARLAYLLPRVLFVVTGRRRLTWGDRPVAGVYYSGPEAWPELATTQRRLRGLSHQDCTSHLRRRLTVDGRPAVPDEVGERIAGASKGLPLYLERALYAFETMVVNGDDPVARPFPGQLRDLVLVQTRHFDGAERDLVRAAALLGSFSPALASAAAGAPAGDATQLFDRDALFERTGDPWLTHRVHEEVREALRSGDVSEDQPWTPEDWRAAARRALTWLEAELAADVGDPARGRDRLARGFTLAVDLAATAGVVPFWLWRAAYAARLLSLRDLLQHPARRPGPSTPELAAFAVTCLAMVDRLDDDHRSSEARLCRALDVPELTGPARAFVHHRLAKVLEVGAERRAARAHLERARTADYPMAAVVDKDLAFYDIFSGDPGPARRWSVANAGAGAATTRAQANGLGGWSHWLWGEFELAERCYRRTLDDAELVATALEQEVALRNVAIASCWLRPAAADAARHALEANVAAGRRATVAHARLALAVCGIGRAPEADTSDLVSQATGELLAIGAHADLFLPLLVTVLADVVAGRADEAVRSHEHLVDHLDRYGMLPHLASVTASWLALVGRTGGRCREPEVWPDRGRGLAAWRRVAELRRA